MTDITSQSKISILGIEFDNPILDLEFGKKFIKVVEKGTRKESFIIPLYSYHNEGDCVVCWGYDLRVGKMGGCELDGKRVSDKGEIELCKSLIPALGLKFS